MSSLSKKQQFWLDHLHACDEQGITMKQYAAEHTLAIGAFYEAKAALRKKGLTDTPAKNTLFAQTTISTCGNCQLAFAGGVTLTIDSHCDPLWAASLIKALQ
jgi:hypothetical protein